MKPLPWSPSALSDFVNCPRSYHEKRVLKRVKDEPNPYAAEGIRVHKAFEDRQVDGAILPPDLDDHEEFMLWLVTRPGQQWAELKAALNTQMQPCEFFAPDVWTRLVIDFHKIHDDKGLLVDYKTGKQHSDFDQLILNALWMFAKYPQISEIMASYYWTQTRQHTYKIYARAEIPQMWAKLIPDLKQYREAFKTDTWQPRQSGLCAGYCPVKTCEFWRPKARKR